MYFRFLLLFLLLSACSKKESFDQVQIFGHAGNGIENMNSIYHDNSQESIDLALSMNGCDGVEIDLQLSKDGELYLFHDDFMKKETNEEGCVSSKTNNELSKITYTTIHQEHIVKLTDLKVYGKTVFFDLKKHDFCANKEMDLAKIIEGIDIYQTAHQDIQIYVITNHLVWVQLLKQKKYDVFFAAENVSEVEKLSQNSFPEGLMFKNDSISKDQIKQYQNAGFKVAVFEVRSPKGSRKALNKLPDFILSDDIRTTLIEKYK